MLFSVGHPSSLQDALEKWVPEITQHCPTKPFLLVGMRTDLRSTTEDTEDHADFKGTGASCFPLRFGPAIAKSIGAVMYKECSALTGEGVKDAIEHAVRAALNLKNTFSITEISGYEYGFGVSKEWRKFIDGLVQDENFVSKIRKKLFK